MGERGATSLGELKEFLAFLGNLWAALAGLSVLFPASNVLVKAVPLARWSEGGFAYLPPPLVAALSTVACAFAVLAAFGRRREVAAERRRAATDGAEGGCNGIFRRAA